MDGQQNPFAIQEVLFLKHLIFLWGSKYLSPDGTRTRNLWPVGLLTNYKHQYNTQLFMRFVA